MRRLSKLCLILFVVALAGCASLKYFPATLDRYPPVEQDSVLVFFSTADIKVTYTVIGEILAEGSSGWGVNNNDLVKKAQKKAGEMGADAILVQPTTKATGSERVMGAVFGTSDNKQRVTALRLKK